MKPLIMKLSNPKFWYFFAFILLLPALFINLGITTLNDDEAIRTLVAMEMDLSNNFILTTLNGAFYASKPPLFNWVLVVSFKIFGGVSEWAARIPNIFFLLLFGYTIFYYSKKYLSKEYAVLNALMFITCGRILFWDSMLAYIDILYSLVTFTSFMVIFHQYEKKNFWKLFIYSYILCVFGFLLKGFPTILFQGITLVVYFTYKKTFKKLFSFQHLVGLLIFAIFVGAYYYSYNQQADLEKTFSSLLDQSTRRTSMHSQYDYKQFFLHVFTYPLENIFHFLPWSIMVIYLFKSGIRKTIFAHDFLAFCTLIFLSNIIVYWVSVEVYPRYILMLIPLVFSVLLFFHKKHYDEETLLYKIYFRSHQVLFVLLIIAPIFAIIQTKNIDIPHRYLKAALGTSTLLFIFYFFNRYKNIRLITFVCAVLVLRILFNWIVIEERHQGDQGFICKEQAIQLGKDYKDLPLNIYLGSNIDLTSSVYITRERNAITPRTDSIQTVGVTIYDTSRYELPIDAFQVGEICVREGKQTMLLVRKRQK